MRQFSTLLNGSSKIVYTLNDARTLTLHKDKTSSFFALRSRYQYLLTQILVVKNVFKRRFHLYLFMRLLGKMKFHQNVHQTMLELW